MLIDSTTRVRKERQPPDFLQEKRSKSIAANYLSTKPILSLILIDNEMQDNVLYDLEYLVDQSRKLESRTSTIQPRGNIGHSKNEDRIDTNNKVSF